MNGKILKDIRYIAGFTQKEIGEFIGVTQSAIAQMEKETIKILPETKMKILKVINDKGLNQQQVYLLSEQLKKR